MAAVFTTLFRPPNLKLKAPHVEPPPAQLVFAALFFSYFLIVSGIIYDVIIEPPSIGSVPGPNGTQKPSVFLEYRLNGQFIIEGLSAGMVFCFGSLGFILLDKSNDKFLSRSTRYAFLGVGMLLILGTYNLIMVFIKIKMPGYMMSE
eukprot:TRINITY_DN2408_c0_g4_i1.p1 TRINITY_DN2408_c0_g4~~TRINITY_DN2408_c0_g4_i1.p1  ORF type:complete len:160 (+),score=27.59 TRINITY_DN2408_c0_g4_i1:42-482(+)